MTRTRGLLRGRVLGRHGHRRGSRHPSLPDNVSGERSKDGASHRRPRGPAAHGSVHAVRDVHPKHKCHHGGSGHRRLRGRRARPSRIGPQISRPPWLPGEPGRCRQLVVPVAGCGSDLQIHCARSSGPSCRVPAIGRNPPLAHHKPSALLHRDLARRAMRAPRKHHPQAMETLPSPHTPKTLSAGGMSGRVVHRMLHDFNFTIHPRPPRHSDEGPPTSSATPKSPTSVYHHSSPPPTTPNVTPLTTCAVPLCSPNKLTASVHASALVTASSSSHGLEPASVHKNFQRTPGSPSHREPRQYCPPGPELTMEFVTPPHRLRPHGLDTIHPRGIQLLPELRAAAHPQH